MGLCQGKAAPIEPSNGPAPVAQRTAAATPGPAPSATAVRAASAAVELTDDQINKWIALGKTAHQKRTWSDPHCSPDQVRQNDNKIREMRDKSMHDEKMMGEMMAMLTQAFNKLLPPGQTSLGWDEMSKMQDEFAPMHDKIAGGHWCWDQESAKEAHNYMASLFGSNCRVTCEQWMSSFGPYMKKVQPYVECIDLSPEQIKEWIDLTAAAYAARKWSDSKCNPEQVKACNRKIQIKVAEMGSTEEGMSKMMKQISGAWDGLLLPGQDTLGWSEMRKMQFVYAPIHDEIAGGHWIWDEETAKAQFEFSVGLFGFNGRWTKTQWMGQFIPYMMYVKPTVEPNVLLPAQAEEWVMLSTAADQASSWSNKSCTPEQAKEGKQKIAEMRKEMMKTEEGRKKMMDSLMAAFKAVCPAGQLTAGCEDMMKMTDHFAPMHDKYAGGHVCWEEKTAKAAFDFQVKKFGTGGRFTLTQWMASLVVFATEINPFVNPKIPTKEQMKQWVKLSRDAYEARKWSNSKCTPIEILEANEKIQHMRQELSKTAQGREMIKNRMVDAFNNCLPAGKDSCGFDEMKHMQDIFAPTHDSLAGGHWCWEDKTSKASFEFMVGIFGEGGRVTLSQWMNSWIPYFRYVNPFVEEKNLEPEQIRMWVDLTKAAKAARTWSNKACTPEQVIEADKKIEDTRNRLSKTEEGRDKMMNSLMEMWISLLNKGERTLGWDQFKDMGTKFQQMHDKLAGGDWIWDDKTAKASFDFTTQLFGEGGRISFPQWMAQRDYYIKWIQPFADTPTLTAEQATQWVALSKKAFEARKWSDSKCTPAQVIEADNKIKAMRNEMRTTPEGQKKMVMSVYNAFATCMDKHTETCGWDELKKMGEQFGPMHDKLCGGHWIWDDATAKPQYEFGVAIFGSDGRYSFSQFMAQVQLWRKICEPLVEDPHLSRMQDRQWVNLAKKAKGAARWSNAGMTRQQIQDCSRKFSNQFKANAADPTKGKEQMKMMSDMFDSVCKKDSQTAGWEEMCQMRTKFYPIMDKAVGGHFIQEDTTAKAAFDFAVNIFGSDMRFTKSQWFAQIRYYMKIIEPFVETPILTPEQVKEWIKLGKDAMVARKWSDPKCTPLEVRQASKKIDDMRQEMRKTPQGNMKMFEALSTVFDSLLPKDKDSLGWEEFKLMQDKFAPEHDKIAGGHWCWDDATAKTHFEFGVNIFGGVNCRYTKPQWFAQLIYYLRVVNPFVDPPQLSKAQAEEWLKLTKTAMAARKWGNPGCTPSMIRACDLKIRENRDMMKKSKDGREKFMKRMQEVWQSLLPAGEEELGWEQMRKMSEIFRPDIDKINAPHQNAHWCWDDETAKAAFEFGAKIFGSPGCKYSLSQWFAMMIAYDRYIEPFAEPKHLTKEMVQGWVKVQKAALEKRTWGNPMCTPEMIVDCDLKIRTMEDAMMTTVEGREKFGNKMMEIWQQLAPQGSDELGWEEMKKLEEIFAPEIAKVNAPHENAYWKWEDASAKAAFEYSAKLYGSSECKFTIAQWFAMAFAYNSYVKPLVQPQVLTKEQIDEWVKVTKEAMAARKWGNPNCTPQMVIDCDLNIRASRAEMRKTQEGRDGMMKMMDETWTSLCPPGHDDLGWEELKKMYEMFYPSIDKINAPHENAHWEWDDATAHKSFEFHQKIFGTSHGTYTLPQWFAMMMSFSRNVEPFVEPKQLSQDQINTWVDLTKKSLAARKWSVDGLTPEQVQAKSTEIQAGQMKAMDKLMPMAAKAFQTAAGVNCQTVGWEGIKEVRDSFQGMDDKMFGGHFIWDDATSKASFDFVVKIFGEPDCKISFCQWAAQVECYMKNVFPLVQE